MKTYEDFRKEYPNFIYEGYEIKEEKEKLIVTFDFNIPNLTHFYPKYEFSKFEVNTFSKYLIFHIGLIELISYWKCTLSPNVIIKAGYINQEQINWFKKLYFNGLGELFYRNNIDLTIDNFMNISCKEKYEDISIPNYNGKGNLIPIGGGKDSNVTLEILKNEDNSLYIINPNKVTLDCSYEAGYNDSNIVSIKRILDKKIIELNNKGFINGHTPFNAIIAFTSYLCAYINNKKYIVLSNESSANESNVVGTNTNHQYSKSYEFENDFNNYTKKYFKIDINYFSLLRPLTEYQIAMLFSKYEKYHDIFKSCNVGSKKEEWEWCNNCPKCLFVFIILSPFLYKEKLIKIFKEDLFEKKELLNIFIDLIGYGKNKPFECVGTYTEIRYALTKTINKLDTLPYLLKYYKDNYDLEDLSLDLEHNYNKENNLNATFEALLKKELNKYV